MTTKLTCCGCGHRFHPRDGRTIHVHYTVRMNTKTGELSPADKWDDFCSQRCRDRALGCGAGLIFLPGRTLEEVVRDILSETRN
jgi:hypothetical protein